MKNVILLAAGVGSRLRPLTNKIPKCLVPINESTILHRIINQFKKIDKQINFYVVLGYKHELVIDSFKNENINFILNENYTTTNNMFSLGLALNQINNSYDTVIANADCVYDFSIIKMAYEEKNSGIFYDKNFFNEESMKIEISKGRVTKISKEIVKQENTFVSIDLYHFCKKELSDLKLIISNYISSNKVNFWTEMAINELLNIENNTIKPFDIQNKNWFEIDNHEDLKKANMIFNNEI